MKTVRLYRVDYDRDESGHWIATVRGVPGCHTYGRTIEEARRRVREALSTAVDDADDAAISDNVKLPKPIKREVANARRLRRTAEQRAAEAARAARSAVKKLRAELGLSVRDAGLLIGVSGARVHQLEREDG